MKHRKNMNAEERRQRAIVILIAYAIFFALLFILILTNKTENVNSQTKDVFKTKIVDIFKDYIENKNYKYTYTISDNLKLNASVYGEETYGEKIYNNITTEYLIRQNNIFIKNKEKYIKNDTFNLYEEYDKTFLELENLQKLLGKARHTKSESSSNYKIEKFTLLATDYLNIYNNYNLTKITTEKDSRITATFKYNKESIIIEIPMSEVYKLTHKTTKTIDYTFEFYDKDKVRKLNIEE